MASSTSTPTPATPRRATRTASSPRRRITRPTYLPERDPSKHNLEHFERFAFTCRLPDGGGRVRLHDSQLAKLEDYFAGILENLWLEPTGAGKSTILGLVALHHGTYVRTDPNVFVLGGLGGHGRNTLDAASGFVGRSDDLSRWWEPQEYGMGRLKSLIDHHGRITVASAGRRVGGRGGSSVEGTGPTLILVEELHRHEDNGAAVATLVSKTQKRSATSGQQVQVVIGTTAGDTLESPLGRLIQRATDTKAGCTVETDRRPGEYYRRAIDADGDLVMHEWAVPEHIVPPRSDAPREEVAAYLEHVKRANPMPIVTERSLRLTYKALGGEPWIFQRQNANQWVLQGSAAIDRVGWQHGVKDDLSIPEGAQGVFVGLDTSTKWASTAIVPVWVDPATGRPRTAGGVVLKSRADGSRIRLRGAIEVLLMMCERWPDLSVVFDRNMGGGLIGEQLEEDHGLTVIDHGQGVPFDLASMLLGELVEQRGLDHDGNADVTEHVLNAIVRSTARGKRWRLEEPGDGKLIDAADALAMAVHMAMQPAAETVAPDVEWFG